MGLDIPAYPVKGYSLTIPLLDETYKIALARLGDRIRVGGMAELAGFDLRLNPRQREGLEKVTRELFPSYERGNPWPVRWPEIRLPLVGRPLAAP